MSLGLWATESEQGIIMWTDFNKALTHAKKIAGAKVREATLGELACWNRVAISRKRPLTQLENFRLP